MDKTLLALVTLAAVIVAGCTPGAPQANLGNEQQNTVPGEQNTQQQNVRAETLAQLFTRGQGVKCTYTTEVQGANGAKQKATATFYMKGANTRSEFVISGAKDVMTSIGTTEKVYVSLAGNQAMQGSAGDCAWIEYSINEYDTNTPEIQETQTIEQVNQKTPTGSVDYRCEAASVPDSMFQPTGKTCTMQDLIGSY